MVFVISGPSLKMSSSGAFVIFIGESNLFSKTVFDCWPNIEEEIFCRSIVNWEAATSPKSSPSFGWIDQR